MSYLLVFYPLPEHHHDADRLVYPVYHPHILAGGLLYRSLDLCLCGRDAPVVRPRVIATWFGVYDRGFGVHHPDVDLGHLFYLVEVRRDGFGARIRPTWPYYLGDFVPPGENDPPWLKVSVVSDFEGESVTSG